MFHFGLSKLCAVGRSLLVVGGGDALEEDLGGGGVDVGVDPSRPCGEALGEGGQSVHVLVDGGAFLEVVPPARRSAARSVSAVGDGEEGGQKFEGLRVSRLAVAPVEPPVPCVEDEQVNAKPCAAALYGVQLQHPADLLADNIHQESGPIVHHGNPEVLHFRKTKKSEGSRYSGQHTKKELSIGNVFD